MWLTLTNIVKIHNQSKKKKKKIGTKALLLQLLILRGYHGMPILHNQFVHPNVMERTMN